ncbi:hypothetical protein BD770DRAFT_409087 [Pilaira anomala]|nr:hypothetical protein BD770DRAFT_409087 [Pilaira anomala]
MVSPNGTWLLITQLEVYLTEKPNMDNCSTNSIENKSNEHQQYPVIAVDRMNANSSSYYQVKKISYITNLNFLLHTGAVGGQNTDRFNCYFGNLYSPKMFLPEEGLDNSLSREKGYLFQKYKTSLKLCEKASLYGWAFKSWITRLKKIFRDDIDPSIKNAVIIKLKQSQNTSDFYTSFIYDSTPNDTETKKFNFLSTRQQCSFY